MNESKARELLGITAKSSLHLNASQLDAVSVMVNSVAEYDIQSGQLRNKEYELAGYFYNIVSDNGALKALDWNTWNSARKLVTSACATAHDLSEDRVRHIVGSALKLLSEGVVLSSGVEVQASKPAKATPDAVRMSAKRKAQQEKFKGKSDSDLLATAEELGNSGNYAEAGEFAKELENRQKTQAKATAKAERSGRTELNKEVRGGLKDASTELAAYMAWLVKHEESQAEFIGQQINAWKEHTK